MCHGIVPFVKYWSNFNLLQDNDCVCVYSACVFVCVCYVWCFWTTQVYTVGPDYAHAEARKSPALDGKVERDSEGKEIRYPVMLTSMEKLVARKVCLAFKVNSVNL